MLSELRKDDILLQRAVIIEKRTDYVDKRNRVKIHVSDENGVISEPQTPDNTCLMLEENFKQQYAPDKALKDVYLCKVQIYENDPKDSQIWFYRLDTEGKKNGIVSKEEKVKFFKTHFLESFDFGTICQEQEPNTEDEIIDLEEEVG